MTGDPSARLPLAISSPLALPETWLVHSDGSAVPNPGRMGLGAVITAPDGVVHTLSIAADGRGCNNEAELRAVLAALHDLQARGATRVRVSCDNSVVVSQLMGDGMDTVERLAPLFAEARTTLQAFADASIRWIPRHRNRAADALARAAVGLPPKPVPAVGERKRKRQKR
ncbi:MAG: ribonuclease HI family protein [Polaromonas sp.]|nr:ribonuclease HI family protein [Polaromonas sp.]